MKTMQCRWCNKTFQNGQGVSLSDETLKRLEKQGSITEGICEDPACIDASKTKQCRFCKKILIDRKWVRSTAFYEPDSIKETVCIDVSCVDAQENAEPLRTDTL